MLGGVLTKDLLPAAVGAGGALALDMLWPHLPLPAALQAGPMVIPTRLAGAVAVGIVGGMIAGKRFGTMMTIGAMMPTIYDIAKGYIAANNPAPAPSGAPPAPHAQLQGYAPLDGLGWPSPARMAGYAPLAY
jgi:hypothetical protein